MTYYIIYYILFACHKNLMRITSDERKIYTKKTKMVEF